MAATAVRKASWCHHSPQILVETKLGHCWKQVEVSPVLYSQQIRLQFFAFTLKGSV